MKRVGIIGGLGPASTVDYYNGIISASRAIESSAYPEIIIYSVDMIEMMAYAEAEDWGSLAEMLRNAVWKLADAGAEVAAMACNTTHIVYNQIAEKSALPLISIVSAACDEMQKLGVQRAAVIGTAFTMRSGLYTDALSRRGIKPILPSESEQGEIASLIYPNLEDGIVIAKDKERMLEIAEKLIRENDADCLLLGCTELPLMIKGGDLDTVLINTTQIHIGAIVSSMFS
ncbi:MAG: amino acid racemase [Eubacteriaceae bacterium]|jgi:aspartate racemase|nr:amino acid racemase [Eubacteriaceae bacterium]